MTVDRSDVDLAVEPKRPDAPLGELFSEMTQNMGTLFRQEVELAKTEAKEEAAAVGKASAMLVVAGVAAVLALAFLSAGLAWLLDNVMGSALAFALVGAADRRRCRPGGRRPAPAVGDQDPARDQAEHQGGRGMGQSAEELRYEIADTRAELGQTLDAIGDRVSPGRMIERRKNRFVLGMRSAKDRIMGTATDAGNAVTDRAQGVGGGIAETAGSAVDTVRNAPEAARQQAQGNPVMAGAVAFGLGFLVAAAFPPSRTEEQLAEQAMDKAEPVKRQLMESGQEVAEHLKDSAAEAVEQVKQTATEGAGQVADTAKEASQTTKDAVRDAAETTPGGHEPLTRPHSAAMAVRFGCRSAEPLPSPPTWGGQRRGRTSTRGRGLSGRWLVAIVGWGLFVAALLAAHLVRDQLPWVPMWYLGTLLAIGVAAGGCCGGVAGEPRAGRLWVCRC